MSTSEFLYCMKSSFCSMPSTTEAYNFSKMFIKWEKNNFYKKESIIKNYLTTNIVMLVNLELILGFMLEIKSIQNYLDWYTTGKPADHQKIGFLCGASLSKQSESLQCMFLGEYLPAPLTPTGLAVQASTAVTASKINPIFSPPCKWDSFLNLCHIDRLSPMCLTDPV